MSPDPSGDGDGYVHEPGEPLDSGRSSVDADSNASTGTDAGDPDAPASTDAGEPDAPASTDTGDPDAPASPDAGDPNVLASVGSASADAAATDGSVFGVSDWVLVGALILCTLVIPVVIYVYPYWIASLGFSTFIGTYLILPLIPALVLGVIAVWTMTGVEPSRR